MHITNRTFSWAGTSSRSLPGILLLLMLADAPRPASALAAADAGNAARSRRTTEPTEGRDPEATAEAVATLLHSLQSGRLMHRDRRSTIAALGRIGPAAAVAIPTLEADLTNHMVEVAFEAFTAVGAIRNESPLTRSALLESGRKLLAAPGDIFRGRNAFRALQGLRALPRDEALKFLRDALTQDAPPPQQVMALQEIERVGPTDPETVAAVLPSLASLHGLIMSNAVAALAKAPLEDARVRETLAGALLWHSDQAAVETAKLIGRSASASAACMPKVIAALQQSTGRTDFRRIGAYLFLLRVAGREVSAPAVPMLVGFLSETSPIYQDRDPFYAKSVRRYVLIALGDLGAPPEAIPTIIDELTNPLEPATIAAAARAAGSVTGGQEQVVPFLRRALARRGYDSGVRLDTIEVKTMPPPPLDTSPYLEIIRALARLGPPAKAALPELAARARDPVRRSPQYPPYQQAAARAAVGLSQ